MDSFYSGVRSALGIYTPLIAQHPGSSLDQPLISRAYSRNGRFGTRIQPRGRRRGCRRAPGPFYLSRFCAHPHTRSLFVPMISTIFKSHFSQLPPP
eukprot:1334520-Amorphochlora_amoeboformis.AAC.2